MQVALLCILALWGLSGCAYQTQVSASVSPAVYSFSEERLQGKVMLYLADWEGAPIHVRPKTHFCSAHTFPLSLGEPAQSAFQKATQASFSEVIFTKQMPTREHLKQAGAAGLVVVKMNQFTPEITFLPGFWTASATAIAELYIDVAVYDVQLQRIYTTTLGASRQASGDGGGACQGGAAVLGDAVSKVLRETTERYVERLNSNKKVRQLFGQGG